MFVFYFFAQNFCLLAQIFLSIDKQFLFSLKAIHFNPGFNSNLFQIDSSSVVGNNVVISSVEEVQGGLMIRGLTGDFFRVWENKPQVQLYF